MLPTEINAQNNQNNWLLQWKQNANAKLNLICFPFAGGGAFYYKTWADILAPDINLIAVQLPGRENRVRESPLTQMNEAIDVLVTVLGPYLNSSLPFVFFGHSMGGSIAFNLCRELRRLKKTLPVKLFISAAAAPQLPRGRSPLHSLSDDQLAQELIRYGGTAKALLEDKEFFMMIKTTLCADSMLFESGEYVDEPPLDIPITLFGSEEDNRVTVDQLNAWKQQTTAPTIEQLFPGGHFFLKDNMQRNAMLKVIVDQCAEC